MKSIKVFACAVLLSGASVAQAGFWSGLGSGVSHVARVGAATAIGGFLCAGVCHTTPLNSIQSYKDGFKSLKEHLESNQLVTVGLPLAVTAATLVSPYVPERFKKSSLAWKTVQGLTVLANAYNTFELFKTAYNCSKQPSGIHRIYEENVGLVSLAATPGLVATYCTAMVAKNIFA